jgi:phosphoglucomutase
MMKSLFDFDSLKRLLERKDFSILIDGMHGVAGPYLQQILGKTLAVPENQLMRSNALPDFGGCHPDPNLTYAAELVNLMGLGSESTTSKVPDFGAACDGDADRNMVLGGNFFVTPSDSIAIIAANYKDIPYLSSGITGAARSMPTSAALDQVMKEMNLPLFEVPTGWKYFGTLLDSGKI